MPNFTFELFSIRYSFLNQFPFSKSSENNLSSKAYNKKICLDSDKFLFDNQEKIKNSPK